MIKIEAIAAKLDFGTVFQPEKENSKNGESCAKKYEEQSLLFPAFSSPTHYCVGPHLPPAWIKVGKNRYLT